MRLGDLDSRTRAPSRDRRGRGAASPPARPGPRRRISASARLSLLAVAGRSDHVCSGAGKLARGHQPEAAVGAGDDRGATGLIRDRLMASPGDRIDPTLAPGEAPPPRLPTGGPVRLARQIRENQWEGKHGHGWRSHLRLGPKASDRDVSDLCADRGIRERRDRAGRHTHRQGTGQGRRDAHRQQVPRDPLCGSAGRRAALATPAAGQRGGRGHAMPPSSAATARRMPRPSAPSPRARTACT